MSCYIVPHAARRFAWAVMAVAATLMIGVLTWQSITSAGDPNPIALHTTWSGAVLDIGVLVFREGLECVLVLAAITAGLTGANRVFRHPVAMGAGAGFVATLITWCLVVQILDDISQKIPALELQAATGLLAVIVLLIVMNWFFHKMYWTGWISLHNRRKQDLLERSSQVQKKKVVFGMALLGFSSLYREGVEVVLFLQSYRLKLGNGVILYGVLLGLLFSGIVAVLTFVVHRKLPHRRMLVFTGILLGFVLFVMVGEQAQEMQLAHWLPTTEIPWLVDRVPAWMKLWFSIFPTVETLAGQAIALVLVLGSYFIVQELSRRSAR